MLNLFRRLLTLLICLAVPATFLVVTTQPASAYTYTKKQELRGARVAATKVMARAIEKNSFNSTFTAMNYGDVDRIFRRYQTAAYAKYTVDWRRQFAVGFYQVGGRINNISRAEMNVIKARRAAVYGSGCPQCRNADGSAAEPGALVLRDPPTNSCGTGESKGPITHKPLYDGRFKYSYYMNSCQTELLINSWESCLFAVGASAGAAAGLFAMIRKLSERAGYIAIIAALVSGVCWSEANIIKRVQISSPKKAIIYRSNPDAIMHSNPNGGQYNDYGYFPQ